MKRPQKKKGKAFFGDRCPNCGDYGAHFVPPSCGEPGFYLCKKKEPCSGWLDRSLDEMAKAHRRGPEQIE